LNRDRPPKGVFYGVGVGPGDPELITRKGYRVLREADVVCAPRSGAGREGLALSVVRDFLPEGQQLVELDFPMTRKKAELELCWEKAAAQIIAFLQEGKKVALITLGDPTLYSTYTYVLKKIKQAGSWPIETIPGVPSFCACAAAASLPLAEGEEKLAVVPAVQDPDTLRSVLQNFENVILLKVAGKIDLVAGILEALQLRDRAVFASRCGLPGGFVENNLEEAKKRPKDYFSLIIVKRN